MQVFDTVPREVLAVFVLDFTSVLPLGRNDAEKSSPVDGRNPAGDSVVGGAEMKLKQAVEQSKINPTSKRLSAAAWKRLKAAVRTA
jgi:hypothetical protein